MTTPRWRARLDRVLEGALVFLMAAMTANVVWQVTSRFVLRSPSNFTDELARYLFIWLGLLGAAYAAGRHMHLAVDALTMRLSPGTQRRLKRLSAVMLAAFGLLVLVVGGSRLVYITWVLGQRSASLQVPMALIYLALPVSGVLMVAYGLAAARGEGPPTIGPGAPAGHGGADAV
jgi:TRAP-type C4-dicarboxylate transport system permease small subunit